MHSYRGLRKLFLCCAKPSSGHRHTQRASYVDVKMKWKKDVFYDSIDVINRSKELRIITSLKNIIARAPDNCIPISAISKMGRQLEMPMKMRVAAFMRKYPSFFEEFTGPDYNLPWFKLTQQAADIDREERKVFEDRRPEFVDRLKRLVLMSREKQLPLQIVQGMQWYLGLPEDFVQDPEENSNGCFRVVEMGEGVRGLRAVVDEHSYDDGGVLLSVLQKDAAKGMAGFGSGSLDEPPPPTNGNIIPFPLFPSKGLRLKRKIADWVEGFQKLPYVSPYEDLPPDLNPCSDVSEKRVAGVLHELLSLFVDHSAERRKILCLRKHLGLPQKFHRAFERHPHVFYLLLKNKTCTVVLKEAYRGGSASAIERHPILKVRKKYVRLIKESETIIRNRRGRKSPAGTADNESDGDVETGEASQGLENYVSDTEDMLEN